MAPTRRKHRSFSVHAKHLDERRGRVVEEASSEAAAIAFVEEFSLPTEDIDHLLTVIVRDMEGGDEHCFTIDLDTGVARPCP